MTIKPELCKDRKTFNNIDLSNYVAEKKYDGVRMLVIKKGDDIILQKRSGKIATHQYPEIVEALKSFEYDIILDGEMCVFINGQDNFNEGISLRTNLKDKNKIYLKSMETPATYMIFDVLYAGLVDLKQKSLLERKKHLDIFYTQSIQTTPAAEYIKLVPFWSDGESLFEQAKKDHWEGIVLKPKEAMYIENARKQWIKIKNTYDVNLVFTHYKTNIKGIKLLKYEYIIGDGIELNVTEDNPITVQCGGAQAEEVKAILDEGDEVYVTITYLNKTSTNRLRMPVFKKLIFNPKKTTT